MKQAQSELVTAEETISKQDISSATALQDLTNTVGRSETAVKTLETSFIDRTDSQSQTEGLTLRELQGLDKALQRTRRELTNNLAKLTELDKDIAKQKLQEAEANEEATNDTTKRDIWSRLKNLEDERAARLEAASANKKHCALK